MRHFILPTCGDNDVMMMILTGAPTECPPGPSALNGFTLPIAPKEDLVFVISLILSLSREAKSLAQGNRARRGQGHGPDSKREGLVGFLAIWATPLDGGWSQGEAGWHREWGGGGTGASRPPWPLKLQVLRLNLESTVNDGVMESWCAIYNRPPLLPSLPLLPWPKEHS